jgi:hypothetical protein
LAAVTARGRSSAQQKLRACRRSWRRTSRQLPTCHRKLETAFMHPGYAVSHSEIKFLEALDSIFRGDNGWDMIRNDRKG